MNSRPAGTDTDPLGSPSKNGMTLRNPCQWRVCASNRSGRSSRPRLVSWTRNSFASVSSYWSTQKTGAECWALYFCWSRWVVDISVTFRKPKMYVVRPSGARLSGWNGGMAGTSGRRIHPSVPAR